MTNEEMKILIIGDTEFEIVDEASRNNIGTLAALNTDSKTNLVTAVNEHELQINNMNTAKANSSDVYTKSETTQAIINAIKTTKYYVQTETSVASMDSEEVYFKTSATDINKVLGIVGVSSQMVLSYYDFDAMDDITELQTLVFNPGQGTHVLSTNEYIVVAYL